MLFGEFLARIRDLECKFGYLPDNYLITLSGKVIHTPDYSLYLSSDAIFDSVCSFRLRLLDPVSPMPGSSRDSDSVIPFLCSLLGVANPYPSASSGDSGARTPGGSGFLVSPRVGRLVFISRLRRLLLMSPRGFHLRSRGQSLFRSLVVSLLRSLEGSLIRSLVVSLPRSLVVSLLSSLVWYLLVMVVFLVYLGCRFLLAVFLLWFLSIFLLLLILGSPLWLCRLLLGLFRLRWSPLSLRCRLLRSLWWVI